MACCLTAPNHYLNRRGLIFCEVLWHAIPQGMFKISTLDMNVTITNSSLQPHLQEANEIDPVLDDMITCHENDFA